MRDDIQVNQANNASVTPLIYAAHNGHANVVGMLLRMDSIDINHAWKTGATPLFEASQNGHAKVVKLLLDKEGIRVNQATKEGETPLSIAAFKKHGKVVNLLKERVVSLSREQAKKHLEEIQTCIVCMDCRPEVVLLPCGHQNLCGACAHQWREEKKGCPMDRMKILEIISLETEE